jgi:predicted DCC family thiol-disulfide oxidoreductase YuxK
MDRIFYDGTCGMCHWMVKRVVAIDRQGTAFCFSPLQGETFAALPAHQRENLPDSVIVLTDDGRLLARSAAALHIGRKLGGIWRCMSAVAGVVPTKWRDWLYDRIAARRRRFAKAPDQACPVMPPEVAKRFQW